MSKQVKLQSKVKQVLGDTLTPVSVYLRLRDRYPNTILLESADYQPNENCFTYVCVNPIADFRVANGEILESYPGGERELHAITTRELVVQRLDQFVRSFKVEGDPRYEFISNGLFGYSSYDAVQYFEDIDLAPEDDGVRSIPEMRYQAFQFIIAINHYRHEMFILENHYDGEGAGSDITELERLLSAAQVPQYRFALAGGESSNFTDAEHREMITKCKKHVFRGDVFQIVPARRFQQSFYGDEFAVYRALRVINPSPYLFFFDYGGYKIFGSSPEAELIVEGRQATIFPIAGTCKRTGSDDEDRRLVETLKADPKENAEHVMLVDLARNDLSKHCSEVHVRRYREVHWYSHVIHLVSEVSGTMGEGVGAVGLLADTFPAGTLSGAPKYRAMELIDRYEKGRRGFYGGAIGFLSFTGDCNHAIIIRSFLSKDNVLYSQAGGGVVADSVPENEVQEVNNKLGALKAAMKMAETVEHGTATCFNNYDSFTYNLVHLVKEIGGCEVEVVRNDKIELDAVEQYDRIMLSPGPGIPSEAGIMPELVQRYAPTKKMIGICLGHQCIGEQFGASLINMKDVVHGKGTSCRVVDASESLFAGVPEIFVGGRYHSWLVSSKELPSCLKVTAEDEDGNIMALAHREFDVKGLQFHPESVLTEIGERIIRNWIEENGHS